MSGPAFRRPMEGKLSSAGELRKLVREVERLGKLNVAAPLEMVETGGVKMIRQGKLPPETQVVRLASSGPGSNGLWDAYIQIYDQDTDTFSDGPLIWVRDANR